MTASVEQRYDWKEDWEKETRRRDERIADRQRGRQDSRGGFVKVHRFAREELRERLLFLRQLAGGPAEEVGFKLAFDCASWVGDLLSEADFRDGVIAHPDTMLAALSGISPSTVRRRVDLLILAGVLEGKAGSRRFTPDAWKWLTEGGPQPVDLVARSLWEGPAAVRTGDHSAVTGEHSAVTGEHSAVTPAPTWANERQEVEELEDLQTRSGGLLQAMEELVPGCQSSRGVAQEVARLRGIHYTDEDVLALVRPLKGAANTPGLVVTVLREQLQPPARVRVEGGRRYSEALQAAAECKHGTPNGTFDGSGRHPRGWRHCSLCRGERRTA